MKKTTRLSNSAINKYLECGRKYKYHYIEKYKGPNKSSALIFGSAIDAGLNALVLKTGNGVDEFNKAWEWAKVSGDEEEHIPDHKDLRYAESDFDRDLLLPEDYAAIITKGKEFDLIDGDITGEELVKIAIDCKKDVGYNNMLEKEVRLFNYINWLSLKRKAPFMMVAYEKWVVPRIKKVYDVQKYVEMNNDSGDKVIGYIDLIVDFELNDGTIVKTIADNKTSTIEYASDAVTKSQQLLLYGLATGLEYGAFFVIRKQLSKNRTKLCLKCGHNGIKEDNKLTSAKTCDMMVEGKRCHGQWDEAVAPEARVDIRVDKLSEHGKSIVAETIDEVNKGIKAEIFPRNFNACNNFNQPCEFYRLCHNNDDSGLIKPDEEN